MRTSTLAVGLLLFAFTAGCGHERDTSASGTGLPPLQAGVAEVRMPVPVGIGTVGFFGANVSAEPSPFARRYPATTRVHGHPTFRAVALSRGPGHEVVFLRSDTVGVFQQFRRAVVLEAEARLGRPIDDALLMAGTHTHSGPGRILDGGGVFDLIADAFFPEFYERMVHAAASAVVQAFDDLKPARVGHAWAMCGPGHADRRCEDGRDYTNDALPLIAVERGGKLDALVFAYAVHSTALGIENLTLSRDVAGAIESQVEGRFETPLRALFFNSWGADMAPGNPEVPTQPGAAQPNGYERMSKVGYSVAEAVSDAIDHVEWEEDPEIFAGVHRVPLNRTAIGYADGVFPYQWGGVFCGGTGDTDCDPATTEVNLDKRCIPFPPQYPVPPQTEISAGRVGALEFVTFPGEPGTLLAEKLLGQVRDQLQHANVMLLGYTQDYTGYSILEDDWVQGGYEASGALWGPRQGEYLVQAATSVFRRVVVDHAGIDPLAPAPMAPFDVDGYTPYAPTSAEAVGEIVTDVLPSYRLTDVVSFAIKGSDPWLGTPTATLVREGGEPVVGAGGHRIDSDGYGFWVDLKPRPGYSEDRNAATRAFVWTFSMPSAQSVAGIVPDLTSGRYRLSVNVPTASGHTEIKSGVFRIEAN